MVSWSSSSSLAAASPSGLCSSSSSQSSANSCSAGRSSASSTVSGAASRTASGSASSSSPGPTLQIRNRDVEPRPPPAHSKVSRALAVLIAAVIWLLKTLLVKLLVSSFHVLRPDEGERLPPLHPRDLVRAAAGRSRSSPSASAAGGGVQLQEVEVDAGRMVVGSRREASSRRIDAEKLKKLSRSRAKAWGVKRLARTVGEMMQDFNDTSEMSSKLEA